MQFLDLQLELLDEFRIRLLQLARQDKFQDFFVSSKASANISPILNTLAAVINVLDDWTDLPVSGNNTSDDELRFYLACFFFFQFFVQLFNYKTQTENIERLAAEATSADATSLPWLRTQPHLKTEEGKTLLVNLFFGSPMCPWTRLYVGSVFDGIIELLKRMRDDLLRRLVDAVMLEVKAKSQPYRLDKYNPVGETFRVWN